MASPPTSEQDSIRNMPGFDCEFLEPPPENLQTDCPVCHQIIREPYQVTCCGNKYCQSCIQAITNNRCPTCNTEGFSNFPDTGHKQSLYGLKVRCSHQKNGCEWTGELRQLNEHLNTDPLPETQLDGCPLTIINCDFHHVGCAVKLPRQDMPEHQRTSFQIHTSLRCRSQQAEIAALTDKVSILESKVTNLEQNRSLETAFNEFTTTFRAEIEAKFKEKLDEENQRSLQTARSDDAPHTTIPFGPPVLTMTNFTQHKEAGDVWLSPPVYTHQGGYKICLAVHANGHDRFTGTHVTVCIRFMRGEFDDSLKWPFCGKICFRLLDQAKQTEHRSQVANYDYRAEEAVWCCRVTDKEVADKGWSHELDFVAHKKLKPQYLLNDTLLLQVYKVELS